MVYYKNIICMIYNSIGSSNHLPRIGRPAFGFIKMIIGRGRRRTHRKKKKKQMVFHLCACVVAIEVRIMLSVYNSIYTRMYVALR